MTVGFDFGTTNSLVSVVVGGRAIDILDFEGRPHPSVVRYEGEDVVVGRDARQALDEAGLGVHGNTVRSPKIYLGQEVVVVGGVERSPIDIVADVVRYVRARSLETVRRKDLDNLERAVVTIPVTMDGPRRAALREAFARADVSVAQFVHEPFAALYGYIRGQTDPAAEVRRLANRHVLVVDWGGGTLDLTLCRVEADRIVQVSNGGSDEVGGDHFDRLIRNEVETRVRRDLDVALSDRATPEARSRLLQTTEDRKIRLSDQQTASFLEPGYFPESGVDLEYRLTRQELEEITRPLVATGVRAIDALLDGVDMAPGQVSLVLMTGGMAAMPSIRSHLHQIFGAERVVVPENSATLVSQGAAWIAHDMQSLVLAKPIELETARGDRVPLVYAGADMPTEGSVMADSLDLYCTDPTDGVAKFTFVAPRWLRREHQKADPRVTLGTIAIAVDRTAPPMHERLTLQVKIDQDLILTLRAESEMRRDSRATQFHDLEFGMGLPSEVHAGSIAADASAESRPPVREPGGLAVRANIADSTDQELIPGEVLHAVNRRAFERNPVSVHPATELQQTEHLYRAPCSVCGRQWGDPACVCA